jgi:ribose-phosphate pyrophosphokinase
MTPTTMTPAQPHPAPVATGKPNPVNALRVFSGRHNEDLAMRVCAAIASASKSEFMLSPARIEQFPDGELIVKIDDDVRGKDCFVVLSTSTPVNENVMELLIYIDCLRRASARRITAVIPYFGYARQDRKDEGRVPITAKLVANLITAARADRVIGLDLHAAQLQGFFDIPVDHLTASPVLVDYFLKTRAEMPDLCLVSPDVGNVKVAESFANLLGGELAIINKRRISGSEVTTEHIIGNVKGKTVLMVDDMIATGGTIVQAAELVLRQGAKRVIAAATHAVMAGAAVEKLAHSHIDKIVITNTIPGGPRFDPLRSKLVELSVGDLLGEAIYRIHHDLSISALFKKTAGVKR